MANKKNNTNAAANNSTINNTTKKEGNVMNNTNTAAAQATAQVVADAINNAKEEGVMNENEMSKMEQLMDQLMKGLVSGKKFVGQTKEVVTEGLDDDVEQVKGGMVYVTNILADITGFAQLREDVLSTLEAGMDKGTLQGITDMSAEIRRIFTTRIEKLNSLGSEQSLKKAWVLSKGLNILEKGIVVLVWAAKTLAKKLKEWFGIDTDKFPVALKAICNGVKAVLGFAWTVGRIVVTVVGRVVSYMVAGIVKLAAWIINSIRNLVAKIKEKLVSLKNANEEKDIDDDFADDEEDFLSDAETAEC